MSEQRVGYNSYVSFADEATRINTQTRIYTFAIQQ